MTRSICHSSILLVNIVFLVVFGVDSVDSITVNPTTFQCASQYVAPVTSKTYYVSTAGVDSNPGTASAPWLTISHAATSVTPDTTVIVMGGVYHEQVNLKVSGTASGPIVFISQSGTANLTADAYSETILSVIDGTNNKASCSGDVNQVNFNKVSYVHFVGFVVRNNQVASDNCVANGVSVTAPSANLFIANNYIHYIRAFTQTAGNAHGIIIYGDNKSTPSEWINVWHNEIAWLRNGFSESLTINGYVLFVDVSDNLIHNNQNIGIVVAGGYQACPNSALDRAEFVTVSRNIVYNCSNGGADGLYCDGCAYTTFDNNIVYYNDNGIELASENAGWNSTSSVVSNSISFGNRGPGGLTGGYAAGKGKAFNNEWFNNVFYHNTGNEFGFQFYVVNNTMRNNIFVPKISKDSAIQWDDPASFVSSTADYDAFYSTSSAFMWTSSSYTSFLSFQSGSQQELNGKYFNSNPSDLCSVPGVTCVANVPQFLKGCPASPNSPTASPNTQSPTTTSSAATTAAPTTSAAQSTAAASPASTTSPASTSSASTTKSAATTSVATTSSAPTSSNAHTTSPTSSTAQASSSASTTSAGTTSSAASSSPASNSASIAPTTPGPRAWVDCQYYTPKCLSSTFQSSLLSQILSALSNEIVDQTVITVYANFTTNVQRDNKVRVMSGMDVSKTASTTIYHLVIEINYSALNPAPMSLATAISNYLTTTVAATDADFAAAVPNASDPILNTASTTPVVVATSSSSPFPTWAIILISVGGVLLLICLLIVICVKHKKNAKKEHVIPSTFEMTSNK